MAPGVWDSNASLTTQISCYGDKSEPYVNNKNLLEIRKQVCLHTFGIYHPLSNRLTRNRLTTNGYFESLHAELTYIRKEPDRVSQESQDMLLFCWVNGWAQYARVDRVNLPLLEAHGGR